MMRTGMGRSSLMMGLVVGMGLHGAAPVHGQVIDDPTAQCSQALMCVHKRFGRLVRW